MFIQKPNSDNPVPKLHRTQRPSSPMPRWFDKIGYEQDTEAWLAAHLDFSIDYPNDHANWVESKIYHTTEGVLDGLAK